MNKKIIIPVAVFGLVFLTSLVLAAPQITINSPQATSYNSTGILVNVTSNEVVDFYFENARTGRRTVLGENVTSLESNFYGKEGSHEFIIWANNSNGVTSASVSFNITQHNPVNVTSCGYLSSSDTTYVLGQDIYGEGYGCLFANGLRNITLDLNGNRINSGNYRGLVVSYSSDVYVYNGEIYGSATAFRNTYPWMLEVEGSKMKFENLSISGFVGITTWPLENVIFENVSVNSTVGFWFEEVANTYIKNSNFTWNGFDSSSWIPSSAFWTWSDHSSLILENVGMSGFPEYDFYFEGGYTDIYLRSTYIDEDKISYPDWVADTRFFEQHLVIINVTDQFGITGSSSVKVLDNGLLPRLEGEEALLGTLSNPTANVFIPTGETGVGREWITEKLTLARSSSPAVITEYDFSNYTLITRGWGEDVYSTANLSLTDINSTIVVDFEITTAGGESLQDCTIPQMLDLNNDGSVTIQDATIILRKIAGLEVSLNSTKGCGGINVNPF